MDRELRIIPMVPIIMVRETPFTLEAGAGSITSTAMATALTCPRGGKLVSFFMPGGRVYPAIFFVFVIFYIFTKKYSHEDYNFLNSICVFITLDLSILQCTGL
jgi:hypothetical protein